MKKFLKNFEGIDESLFEPLSDEMLSRMKGGGDTYASMPTALGNGQYRTDTVKSDDTPGGPTPV